MPTQHHPDLRRSARIMPRGIVRPWTRAPLQVLGDLAFRFMFRDATRVDLGDGSLFVYRPANAPERAPVLLWMHGGGLVIGDARMDAAKLTALADELGIVVASVQYRLAPQHPYPAALDDCVAAFEWLTVQTDIDTERIMVGGMSAGGHLAAALCQRLHAAGGAEPSFQLLVYPMLDDRSGEGTGPHDGLFRLWDRRSNRQGWSEYLGSHPAVAPAVPARADDLSGLPPAWIGVGSADLFLDENETYAHRLEEAGVPVDLEVVEGAYHGFDMVDPKATVSERFLDSQRRALADHIGRST